MTEAERPLDLTVPLARVAARTLIDANGAKVFALAVALFALAQTMPAEQLPVPRAAVGPAPLGVWAEGFGPEAPFGLRATAYEREQRALSDALSRRFRVAQEAVDGFVAAAYRAGDLHRVDPLLILAVMAIESRFNPVAESSMGAKGLMQIIPRFHLEKLVEHGGEAALLDPEINIRVGAQILREYLHRFGKLEAGLQMYAGASDEPTAQYSVKVLNERARLAQTIARLRNSSA